MAEKDMHSQSAIRNPQSAIAMWTDAQRRAIETRGANLLVAASAGTGKTAVLVERCLQLTTDPKEPTDIDRLLVVTFTEAAAAEMRNRLSETLRKRIEAEPANRRLRRQLILLDRASISTLHAFALRTIQEHFFRLGLAPNLNVMDQEEADLLCAETLDEVFESLYCDEGEAGQRFRRLVGRYGSSGHDEPVRRVVVDLWRFLRSLPWPDCWRERALTSYGSTGSPLIVRFDELRAWYEPFTAALEEDLRRVEAEAREAAQWAYDTAPSLGPYENHFESVAEAFGALLERLAGDGFDGAQQAVADYKYPKIPTVKGVDESLRESAKSRNDAIRQCFNGAIRDGWCAFSGEQWVATLRATRPDVETLFEVVDRFDQAFSLAKRERGEADFQDLERLCFDLLLDREASSPDRLVPSAAAREIRDRFEAVLVDEYQDISPLQDAILHLSSRQDEPHQISNLFMVGDVKQSIYRFRLAEPEIFLQKMAGAIHELPIRRIDLSENFRSRAPLLAALNAVFRQIMIAEVGKIAYEESAELRGGFDYPRDAPPGVPPPTEGVPIEVHLFDRSKDVALDEEDEEAAATADENPAAEEVEELEQIEIEARWVAERVQKTVAGPEFSIWDRGTKSYRPVSYRDIAVLLQTAVYKAEVFVRVMREMGIPAYTDAGSGYLVATEIQDVLSLLQLLDNPHQDIAAAAVLRSPLVGLSEDDLARIRIHRRNGDFFSAVAAYADRGPNEALRTRLAEFVTQIERWRSRVRRGPLAQALWTIYDETGYLDYVTAMEDGAQRRADLIGLYDRARQFDEFSRRGLGRFLEFIRRLQETEGELGAPPAISEAEDVVRVMSIHKSKGLEFPVVFMPDIGKAFNFENARGDLVADRHLGVAMREVDTERGIKYPTAAHLVVTRQIQRETLAEQMRLLYVAMTRAREKLVLCGSVQIERARQKWLSQARCNLKSAICNPQSEIRNSQSVIGALDPAVVGSARSFADWLGPALARLGYIGRDDLEPQSAIRNPQSEIRDFAIHWHRAEEWKEWRRKSGEPDADRDLLHKIAAMEAVAAPPHDTEQVAQVMDCLNWRYPWRPLTELRGKLSVTELKQRFETDRETDEAMRHIFGASAKRRPEFLAATAGASPESPLPAAEIGTATHTVLRHLDLAAFNAAGAEHSAPEQEASVRRQIEQMVARGLLTPTEAASVDAAPIARFLNSPLGAEMRQQPDRVQRELPFSLAVPADEIPIAQSEICGPQSANRKPQSAREWVHVQGVMDCLIERPDGFVLLDFKTDRIAADKVAERAAYYRPQMVFYARAAETIFHRPVIAQVLYFLHCSMTFELEKSAEC